MSKSSGASLSELMTIRDILMGEVIQEFNEKIEALEQQLQEQRQNAQATEEALNTRIATLEAELNTRADSLGATFEKRLQEDRHALGAQLLSLGQHLQQ